MSKLDVYYRGFKNYRKETKKYAECRKERTDLRESNIDLDIILRWEALLSVHIKEYHFINNKHKNFRGKSFSRCK